MPRGLERTRTHAWSAASLQVDGMTAKITTSSIGNSPLLQEAPGVPTSTAPRAPRNSADREFGQTYSYPVRGAACSLRGTRHARAAANVVVCCGRMWRRLPAVVYKDSIIIICAPGGEAANQLPLTVRHTAAARQASPCHEHDSVRTCRPSGAPGLARAGGSRVV